MKDKVNLKMMSLTVTAEHIKFFAEHKEINRSELVRKFFDKYIIEYSKK